MIKYRKRSRGIRQTRRIKNLVIIIAAILLLVVLTVLLGNFLKSKSEYTRENSTPIPEQMTAPPADGIPASASPEIRAFPADPKEPDRAVTSELAERLSGFGYNGVSVKLTDENGRPNYSSSVASSLFGSQDTREDGDLAELISAMHEAGLQVVGCLDVRSADGKDAGAEALRSYEIALVCEAWEAGIDEVVLSGLKFAGDAELCGLSIEYTERIKRLAPGLTVGISFELEEADMGDTGFEMLLSRADFLALKLPPLPEPGKDGAADAADGTDNADSDTSPLSPWLEKLINENLALFTRYSPRVMIEVPKAEDESYGDLFTALEENIISSFQLSVMAGNAP